MFGLWNITYMYILSGAFWFLIYATENITETSQHAVEIIPDAQISNVSLKSKTDGKHGGRNVSGHPEGDFTNKTRHFSGHSDGHFVNKTGRNLTVTQRMVTPCVTPNEDDGYCVPLSNCPKLDSQLSNHNATQFLRRSYCGKIVDGVKTRVCCGKYENFKNLSIIYAKEHAFPGSCGYQNVTIRGRIFGGKEAKLGEFPWVARLIHKDAGNSKTFGCSGFLITVRFVLTAAHCLQSENILILGPIHEVVLGEHNTRTKIDCDSKNKTCAEKLQVIKVKKTFVHPDYDMNSRDHHHDIGLIFLRKDARFSSYVIPICILDKVDFIPFEYWLSGWGSTKTESVSAVKMKVSVPPFSFANCTDKYDRINVKIINKQLCAGGIKGRDSCTGDSGGPLMIVRDGKHWFAAGVVSYGLGCGKEGWPGVYTNVTSYESWIKHTVKKTIGRIK
jgi:hypothetical protein